MAMKYMIQKILCASALYLITVPNMQASSCHGAQEINKCAQICTMHSYINNNRHDLEALKMYDPKQVDTYEPGSQLDYDQLVLVPFKAFTNLAYWMKPSVELNPSFPFLAYVLNLTCEKNHYSPNHACDRSLAYVDIGLGKALVPAHDLLIFKNKDY